MKPLITVSIPVYNGARFIIECLESLRNQDRLEDCEILIVDDQSNDNSFFIIDDYIKSSQPKGNWRIEKNPKNLGLTGNWNRCCELATAEWIMFLFQDDFLEPNAISHRISLINTYSCSLFISDRNYVYDVSLKDMRKQFYDGRLKRLANNYSESTFLGEAVVAQLFVDNFLGQNIIGEPVVGMFRKELLDKYGYFNTNLKQICDYEFWLRVGLNEGFCFDTKKIVNFRVHSFSATKMNSNSKISISKVDRVLLGCEILTRDYYVKFRSWYEKQLYKDSLFQLYKKWCFENIPLNRYFFLYKKLVDNENFKMNLSFIYQKLKNGLNLLE